MGKEFTVEELADAMLRLQEHKASNINLVTAGHFVDALVEVIHRAKEKGLTSLVHSSVITGASACARNGIPIQSATSATFATFPAIIAVITCLLFFKRKL